MKQFKSYILFSFTCITLIVWGSSAFGQHPLKDRADAVEIRYASSQPVIRYTLKVDTADLSTYEVEMRIRNVPDTFRIAMMAHPEYDDRFWRYIKDLHVETKEGNGNVFREDSALWRIVAHGNEVLLQYSIHLPTPPEGLRAAWRPFLSATGGLVGGPQSFMYIVGATLAASYISLELPKGWMIATGLEPTADPCTFYAASAAVLIDAPILIGYFKTWQFAVDQVPHRVCYWPLPNAVPFDTTTLVNYIQRFVQQCNTLFGRLPYREYSFLLQDGAYGALEHCNSVTVGLPAAQIAKDIAGYFGTIAHEYFHTWNLMRIRPVEFGDISYQAPALSRGLWWSEGLTIFYADLLRRRASLPAFDSTRIKHLEGLMNWYFSSPGSMHISPEKVSLASDGPPGMLGDYSASTHLQGELLGTMLDLIIRDATNGKHSIDDVMRKMMERFSGVQGFTNRNIEEITAATCGCNVSLFFRDHVYGNKPIDFNKYLSLAGMHFTTKWTNASDSSGKPVPDLQVYAFQSPGNAEVKLGITDPSGYWGKAGLHTKDVILTVNKLAVKSANDFRQIVRRLQINDTVLMEVQRPTGIFQLKVIVSGYRQPVIRIDELNKITEKQGNLRKTWLLLL
jgi:predicted metalloprotease with PDZ domain